MVVTIMLNSRTIFREKVLVHIYTLESETGWDYLQVSAIIFTIYANASAITKHY